MECPLEPAHLVVQRVAAGAQELGRQRQRRLERLRIPHPQPAAVEVDQQRLRERTNTEHMLRVNSVRSSSVVDKMSCARGSSARIVICKHPGDGVTADCEETRVVPVPKWAPWHLALDVLLRTDQGI